MLIQSQQWELARRMVYEANGDLPLSLETGVIHTQPPACLAEGGLLRKVCVVGWSRVFGFLTHVFFESVVCIIISQHMQLDMVL